MTHMKYALKRGEGLSVITGQFGIGKTTFTNALVAALPSTQWFILNLTSIPSELGGLVRTVTSSLGLTAESNQSAAVLLQLKHFLLEQKSKGRRVLLIIDEAHTLSTQASSELRALTNLHDGGQSLIQIFLVGQESLWDFFRAPDMRDLHQRVIATCHLDPLALEDIEGYIEYRLQKVGWDQDPRIGRDILPVIQEFSYGIPRLINVMCNRLLLFGYVNELHELGGRDAQHVMRELQGESLKEQATGSSSKVHAQSASALASTKVEPIHHNVLKLPNSDINAIEKAPLQQTSENDATIIPISQPKSEKERHMNRTESLLKVLKTLQNGAPDVEAAALITEDGLIIASALPQDLDDTRVGGMSATLLSLGTRAAKELRRGDVQEVIVRGGGGYAVMQEVGRGVLLLVVANENAKLGMIFFDMREAISAIKGIL